ncbi:MAG: hypothetical protein M3232_05140 [Thermoproteota archaeon]|nr:hypothetical protein [Thermoproteota archaeon]
MKNIDDHPVLAFGDSSYGLDIRGYELVPNDPLSIKIAVYTPEIVEAILSDHSEIVDTWLNKLHEKYLTLKKSCELDSNPVACFNMLPLEQFETHFQLWQDGGIITISIEEGKVIRIRNEKRREEKKTPATTSSLVTNETQNPRFTCSMCSSTFSDSEEYYRHRLREIEIIKNRQNQPDTAEMEFSREKDIPPNPIWWLE